MAAINKIALNSPSRQNPSELETAIAGALFDLESNTQDLKATLRPLQFVSAREVRLLRFAYLPEFYVGMGIFCALAGDVEFGLGNFWDKSILACVVDGWSIAVQMESKRWIGFEH